MKNTYITGPALYSWKTLLTGVTLLFMVLMGTTLVMLPFASKQAKASILNAVEEEAEDLDKFIPVTENVPDDLHSQTLIQPPDKA
jgi:hypothetical protein